jgi:hypothetical protein
VDNYELLRTYWMHFFNLEILIANFPFEFILRYFFSFSFFVLFVQTQIANSQVLLIRSIWFLFKRKCRQNIWLGFNRPLPIYTVILKHLVLQLQSTYFKVFNFFNRFCSWKFFFGWTLVSVDWQAYNSFNTM